MTLEQCYNELGGNYKGVIERLLSDKLVQKFVLKFPDDGSFTTLSESLKNGDSETAFRAAHTLKGVCQNLGFDRLFKSSSEITEAFRDNRLEDAATLFPQVESDYKITVAAIEKFRSEL